LAFTFILSGGIHLDGWIDMSDALFSYQNKQKRLLIMEDQQVGAFGVLGLLFICVFKFLFIYEIISISDSSIYIYIVFIPFISRLFTGLGLLLINTTKKTGLGYLYHSSD